MTSNLSVLGMTLKLLLMIVERFYDLGCPVIANFFDPQLCWKDEKERSRERANQLSYFITLEFYWLENYHITILEL